MPPPPASSSLGGFSIREYTSQKRAADFTKCWPFDLLADGQAAASYSSFLPPILVVKFRWWLDVLASSRSKDQIDAIPLLGPVVPRRSCCVSGRGDDSDDRRRKKMMTMKMKKKKKRERSIVEIFAVSPRVAARTKKEARGTRRKSNEKKRKRVEAGMKSGDPITSTRVSEAEVALEMDKVMLETLAAAWSQECPSLRSV